MLRIIPWRKSHYQINKLCLAQSFNSAIRLTQSPEHMLQTLIVPENNETIYFENAYKIYLKYTYHMKCCSKEAKLELQLTTSITNLTIPTAYSNEEANQTAT